MAKNSGIPSTLAHALVAIALTAPARAQQVVEFPLPTPNAAPRSIAAGPDGNFWFTESDAGKIGRITPAGAIVEYPLPSAGSEPWRIAAGPDGALWFVEMLGNRIGRISTSGAIEEFDIPTAKSLPLGIVAGPDGALWFTEREANRVGRITTSGAITEFALDAHTGPNGIVPGTDGALWFAEEYAGRAGRITPAGEWSESEALPAPGYPDGIAAAGDGTIWVATAPGSGGSAVRIPAEGTIDAHRLTDYTLGDPAVDTSGNLWFPTSDGTIGKLDRLNRITVFEISTSAYPTSVALAADGKIWFTESQGNKIGRLDPAAASSCTAPAAPALSVDGGSTTTVAPGGTFTLAWTATLGAAGGSYTVLEAVGGGLGWTTVRTTSATSLLLSAPPEQAGATLSFEVRATSDCGASTVSGTPSNTVTIAVTGGSPPPPPPPPPPSNGCTSAGNRPCVTPVAPPAPVVVEPPPQGAASL
ncbi:MAG TPA: hypothetical protein VFL12_05585 [Thermoanaerobaculia bacterium]|nr:hypothetical protein [Thermoanaerobaculia bacterium]